MTKKQIKMEHSPFHKQRNMKAPRGSENLQTQVSQDMFDDFMLYARQYNAEHPTDKGLKAKALKHIVNEFLNSHALECKCFEDLHVIFVCNDIDFNKNESKPDVDGAIIGFVESVEKFTMSEPFNAVSKSQNTSKSIYALKDFNKETYDMLNLKTFTHEVLFNINPSYYVDFERVKQALQEQHKHIDFDNARICMFNLNNYLDILKDGVYVSKNSTYAHEGLVVLLDAHDYFKQDRVIVRINWSYIAGNFDLDVDVVDIGFFNEELCNDVPETVNCEYWNISSGLLQQSTKLEMQYKHACSEESRLEKELEIIRQNKDKYKMSLDEYKQQ